MDFVADQLANGRRFRVLNIVDDFSRELIEQLLSVSINGNMVSRFLDQLMETRTLAEAIYEIEQWRHHYNHVRPHS
jgi:putative transposase